VLNRGWEVGIPYLKKAVDLDPSYAVAYAWVGAGYFHPGQAALAADNLRKAYNLRQRLTQRDQFLTESFYYRVCTRELDKAVHLYEQWLQVYPLDWIPHGELGVILTEFGQHERAAAETREALRLWPTVPYYGGLLNLYIWLGQWNEAKATFDEALARQFDDMFLRQVRYDLAFLQDDNKSMQEQLSWAKGKPGEDGMFWRQATTNAYHGRFAVAAEHAGLARDAALRSGASSSPADYQASEALGYAEVGAMSRANERATLALADTSDPNIKLKVALAFARAGDSSGAQKLFEELNKEFPLATVIQKYHLPTIRAAIELSHHNPARAITILETTTPFELAGTQSFDNLYPAYLRGLAYLQLTEGGRAAAEFQKLLDHRGIVGTYVTGALAHLQLGRAQAMMGDKPAARKSYQDFLTLWKDADPDIPIYKQAKAEYAKLQ
jgi:tetratricopeptide (TPR) repeat protein